MSEQTYCQFCASPTENPLVSSIFAVCRGCRNAIQSLIKSYVVDEDVTNPAFGFEPVGREYAPGQNELFYLATRNQFYKADIRKTDSGQEIYFQPVPENKPSLSITSLSEELAVAMAAQDFFRITHDRVELVEEEAWWDTALIFAPRPSEYDEYSSGGNPGHVEDLESVGASDTDA